MKIDFAVAALALAMWSMIDAKAVEVTNEKFGIDIPDSWEVKQQPVDTYPNASVMILSAIDAQKTSAVEILVCNNPRGMMVDQPGLVSNIKDSITNMVVSHGGQIQFTGESKLSINDVPAYVIQYTVTSAAAPPILARAYQIAANGKLYLISSRTVDASADAGAATMVESIRFATPPELPKPPISHLRLKIALLVGGVVVGSVAIVAIVIVLRRRAED